ncbi:MAG: hypothetical protein JXB88_21325 [Spirochaetales bacterium]|nr:hypothetical protein [Spirochaetales bacterium]
MNIVYKGETINLDKKTPLGAGGEAVVIKYKNLAFKIYHSPSKERTLKLKAFLNATFSLPENVARPLDLVYNPGGRVIGFAMNVAKDAKDFIKLSNRKFRDNELISTNDVIGVFAHAKKTLDEIHKQGIIIGDLNDLNLLFNNDFLSVFIDVDSYQFGNFPCPVGTEIFLDPVLFGIDLSQKPCFSKETDWYAFAVMIFKSLLFVYPYGGIHKTIKNTFERIRKCITVFDKDVIYPKVGLPPETLDDTLLEYFEDLFKKGKRLNLDAGQIEKYKGRFVPCPKCGLFFYETRKKCPVCFKVTPEPSVDLSQIILKKQVDKEACTSRELFATDGIILFVKVFENRVVVVDYDYRQTTLHIIDSKSHKKVKLWENHLKNIAFDFYAVNLLVASKTDLMIFSCQGEKALPLAKTTSLCFDGEPVFAASADSFYRLTTTDLMKGHIRQNDIIESPVLSIMENQTWLKMSDDNVCLGFFRIFGKYHYFVFSEKGRYELGIPSLDGRIIEHEVLFSRHTLCLLRKSLYNGRTYSHVNMVDTTGTLLYERSEPSLSSDVLKTLSGKALSGQHLIHPTDAGIVVEKAGSLSLKTQTQQYVNSQSLLFLYKDGIVTVNDRRILFLKMG